MTTIKDKSRWWMTAIGLATVLAAAPFTFGQDGDSAEEPRPRFERGPDRPGPGMNRPGPGFFEGIELSPEQRQDLQNLRSDFEEQIRQWREANADAIQGLRDQVRQARESGDAEALQAIRQQVEALNDSRPKLTDQGDTVRALLSPEQVEVFDANVERIRGRAQQFRDMSPEQRRETLRERMAERGERRAGEGRPGLGGEFRDMSPEEREAAIAERRAQMEERRAALQEMTPEQRREAIRQWREERGAAGDGGGRFDRLEDRFDRREDVRDRSENRRDRAENKLDRRENRFDRREDVRDGRHQGGPLDRIEDRFDRREDVRDRAENRRDRAENRVDRGENRRDRREDGRDRRD